MPSLGFSPSTFYYLYELPTIMQCGCFKTSVSVNQTCFNWQQAGGCFAINGQKHVSMVSAWPEVFTEARISDWNSRQVPTLFWVPTVGYFCVVLPTSPCLPEAGSEGTLAAGQSLPGNWLVQQRGRGITTKQWRKGDGVYWNFFI